MIPKPAIIPGYSASIVKTNHIRTRAVLSPFIKGENPVIKGESTALVTIW